MKFSVDHYRILQAKYLEHFPESFPIDLITNYSDILRFQHYLKNAQPERKILTVLLDAVFQKIERGQRFQKVLILKLILNHMKCEGVDDEILIKVFRIYQQLIFNESDEVCWKLSNLIKNRELLPNQINWLLDNYEASEHILNRILRYPVKNKMITQWAETAINNEELWNRKAEIIGCILNFRPKYRHKDHQAMVWGVYYSKLCSEEKKKLLDKHLFPDNLSEVLKICDREGYTDLIEKWYKQMTGLIDGIPSKIEDTDDGFTSFAV